jgi:UDP-N-acetylmuramoylalanine--D-glutamate ligase
MEAAVNVASTLIDKGAILLSPACASFDMFDDFEQRVRHRLLEYSNYHDR